MLSIVLSRIYVLRNQLVHGGATWGSSVNREQLRDCTRFMAKLVPLRWWSDAEQAHRLRFAMGR